MLEKPKLYAKAFLYTLSILHHDLRQRLLAKYTRTIAPILSSSSSSTSSSSNTPFETTQKNLNIVIVGASFAGYHAAKLIAERLPLHSHHRIIVIEPNSHFNFTWLFPRFCVVKGHEHKAFIPYGEYLAKAVDGGSVEWVRGKVASVGEKSVMLQNNSSSSESGRAIAYSVLILATGSGVDEGLPSRTNSTEKNVGEQRLREMQKRVEAAEKIVVVGGGAAGVEVATDAKSLYPDKKVILVHSRSALMHRFGKGLQKAALEGMESLGGEVILGERVVDENAEAGMVTLQSGRVIECDLFINCTGQRPLSDILTSLSSSSISPSSHIKIKPTLQIADDRFPNIYACGDVADTKTPNTNSRSAMRQAGVVAENVLRVVRGKKPAWEYRNVWADGLIELTLGLNRAVVHWGDGGSELLFEAKEKEELMAERAWTGFGVKPFDDPAAETTV